MIKKKCADTRSVKRNFLGGKGSFIQNFILNSDELEPYGRMFAECVLPVGASVGEHTHKGDFEICCFLSGRGKVVDDGQETEVGPGDVNVVHAGHSHSIENIGDNDLRYIAVILYE